MRSVAIRSNPVPEGSSGKMENPALLNEETERNMECQTVWLKDMSTIP